jgi:hypothetical protein
MPTILDVILEADPTSIEVMRKRVQALADSENPPVSGADRFTRLQQIPKLHFMSMEIFEDDHYDPLLVFENNFDGPQGTYWEGVLDQLSEDLRGIFACTKQAKLDAWKSLFADGSTQSLAPFLEAHSCGPSAQHFGAVANSLPRIHRDAGVFDDLQSELGVTTEKYRGLDAVGVQRKLRQWATAKYSWMNQPESPSTAQALSTYKWSALRPALAALAALAAGIGVFLWLCISDHLPNHGDPDARIVLRVLLILAIMAGIAIAALFWRTVRHLEETDFTQDDAEPSPAQMKLFASQEDQIVQNHLASMVLVKPGVARAILIRVSLRLLLLIDPILHSDGYLGSMRTIHFAHWTLVGNSGRLLFFSNFDGSWQSYLDDFVDKAAAGLTLAWGNCVGFPRTQNLIQQGAAHGTEFKKWARQSQTQSILWYSAYPTLTVNQIIRNAGIVDGLRKESMQPKEAEQGAQLL